MKLAALFGVACGALAGATPGVSQWHSPQGAERPRARAVGIVIGTLSPGPFNAITDVPGVKVGHATVSRGKNVRTGVTVVLPHGGNLYREKVPAAICVGNGYGKLVGVTQVVELGELESPIALTNTLNVGKVMDALVGHMLRLPGNERVRSVNVVVGETNDGLLNDIRGRHVTAAHVDQALASAAGGVVAEGAVGAGTGTVCFGFKGGIGTSSRRVAGHTVGVLVQTNYGGRLTIAGVPVQDRLRGALGGERGRRGKNQERGKDGGRGADSAQRPNFDDGSCMIVVATDAPLRARNLGRLAKRALVGMARTGASFSNGSGDYVIAFSTERDATSQPLSNRRMSPLFRAVAEATEEAIINSLCKARTVTGSGRTVQALPLQPLRAIFQK